MQRTAQLNRKCAVMSADEYASPLRPHRPPRVNGLLWGLLLVLIGALLYQVVWGIFRNYAIEARTVTPRGELAPAEQTTIEIYRKASQSVVHIATQAAERLTIDRSGADVGSGVVWDSQGHIVTNQHVIRGAIEALVTLPDRSVWPARLVGSIDELDIAVLKIDAPASRLVPIPIGTSEDLQVGQHVLAIGNPFGLQQTLTTGVLSGVGRQIRMADQEAGRGVREYLDVIQTDAAINPGNSGGPLLDSAARLIGLNTFIFSNSGDSAGIGFAIPVDYLRETVPWILSNGQSDRPGLGLLPHADSLVLSLIASGELPGRGALVAHVVRGSAADRAGILATRRDSGGLLRYGDLILTIDGVAITQASDLYSVLRTRKIGEQVTIGLWRDGQTQTVPVTLEALPSLSSESQ